MCQHVLLFCLSKGNMSPSLQRENVPLIRFQFDASYRKRTFSERLGTKSRRNESPGRAINDDCLILHRLIFPQRTQLHAVQAPCAEGTSVDGAEAQ